MRLLAALAAGLLFGAGLSLSRMIDPAVVLAFLDFAAASHDAWNPALAFVMAGAVLVTSAGYALIFRRRAPLLAPTFTIPRNRTIDRRLIAGALSFGVGWGLVGYCPGPAIAGLAFGPAKTWLFVSAMLVGMALHRVLVIRREAHPPVACAGTSDLAAAALGESGGAAACSAPSPARDAADSSREGRDIHC
jgi:uncharacterized membrane protein YedE/YeeE